MNKVFIILSIALATAYAIPPQVRHGPPASGGFAGAQNVAEAPTVRLSHPLPSTRDARYEGSSSSSSGNYGGGSSSSSSSSSNYNNNQGTRYESTNHVSSYAPPAKSNNNYAPAPPAPASSNYVKTGNTRDSEITILKSSFEDNQDGSYSYAFENSDGTKTEQRGYMKNAGTDNAIFVQEGSYQYYGPDGVVYTVTYIADENGYQPSGPHLPALPKPVRSSDTGSAYAPTTARPSYGSSNNNNYNNNYNNNNNNRNRF